MTKPLPLGTERTDDRGYVWVKAPDHPLAHITGSRRGWVRRHRQRLYDSCNGAPQKCVYCEYHLEWRGHFSRCINVDHFNEVKGDDRIENLFPSCYWCNLFKSGWPLTFEEHWRAIHRFAHLEPWVRPSMFTILIEEWGIDTNSVQLNLQINRDTSPADRHWGFAA